MMHCCSFLIFILLRLLLHASSSLADPHDDCPLSFQLNCTAQSITLGYPFRTAYVPDYCGVLGFHIFCSEEDSYPTIQAGSFANRYLVKGLDLANRTLTIVNPDLILDDESCPRSSINTTWDISPFNYTDSDQKLKLIYNCSSPILDTGFTALPCPADISGNYAYFATESITQYPYRGCSNYSTAIYIALGINQTAMDHLLVRGNDTRLHLVEALKEGFDVTWSAGDWWCSTCVESGGRCGYNATDPSAPLCFCKGNTSSSIRCPKIKDPYDGCALSQFNCGPQSIDIGYPFRTTDRPDYCGVPGFEVSCSVDDYPVIPIGTHNPNYLVKQLDLVNRVLTIVNMDFLPGQSCPDYNYPFDNTTTLDMSPYNYTSRDQMLAVYFYCNNRPAPDWAGFTKLSCRDKYGTQDYYATKSAEDLCVELGCGRRIPTVLDRTIADPLMSSENGKVDLLETLQGGFEVTWTAGEGWCSRCIQSDGRCGYNVSDPKAPLCFCQGNKSYSIECPPTTDVETDGPNMRNKNYSKKDMTKNNIVIGVTVAIGSLLVALFLLALYACGFNPIKICNSIIFRKKNNKAQQVEEFLENYGSVGPKRYSYSDVKKMTKSFSDKLGQGGYGSVFKGELVDGRPVAVKVLSDSKGNGEEFMNEVASIGRTHHVNIVSLLGFCSEGSQRALIYEFMPNGSLEKFIYAEEQPRALAPLGWEKLYEIAIGIGRGLEYLHRGCHMRILHFDIKPHNILLDEDFCPKISDFGLAKLCPGKVSIISMAGARGTAGYIAPEVFCRNFGGVSSKSDVYSYGMMVLEMVGGRKNIDPRVENASEIYFPQWAYHHLISLEGDLKECGVSTQVEGDIARKMIFVGMWCIQNNPANRPSITRVVEMLQGTVEDLKIPPKPFLSSPSRSFKETSPTAVLS